MAFKRIYSRSGAGTFPNSAEGRVKGGSTTSSSLITTLSRNVVYPVHWEGPVYLGCIGLSTLCARYFCFVINEESLTPAFAP